MAIASIFKKAYWTLAAAGGLYFIALGLLSSSWLQRHALYANKINTAWLHDPNKPEQFGFSKNQIQPFNITTPDNEVLYAWHILPLGLYARHEAALIEQPQGLAKDVTRTKAFKLLADDPQSCLVISFHGNAGTVAQGWRTDTYRALSSGSNEKIHVVTVDYRGFGYSTGTPTEEGLIIDGVALVDWALSIAKVPPERIILLGQSLGTAVTTAVAEHFVLRSPPVEFAGVVLAAAFSDIPTLMLTYSAGGIVPILSPLRPYPRLQKWFIGWIRDTWNTKTRLANFVRHSRKVRLELIHARNDFDIPWKHSDALFYAAANATTEVGMTEKNVNSVKTRIDLGEAGWVNTWNAGGNKKIRQEIVLHGGKINMPEVSKETDPKIDEEVLDEVLKKRSTDTPVDDGSGEDEHPASTNSDAVAASSSAKKKGSKRAALKKKILGDDGTDHGNGEPSESSSNPASKLTNNMVEQLMEMNPALKSEFAGMDREKAAEAVKKLDVSDLLTGMSVSGKNQKNMASYKFWQTQPVPKFDETTESDEGPIELIDPEKVPKEPYPLIEGFEWVTMDLTKDEQLKEVYELLTGHYVEDDQAMFRFNYSLSFLNWALKSPGWQAEWHVGVRASKSQKLVAFISGVPVELRVRSKILHSSEINFLCVHKKLRGKRLAPVLIKEITRRCYIVKVFQAIYTGGILLPKPVSTCRYFHRSLDWLKLYEVGFSPLPPKSTKARQITKYHLPSNTSIPGLRPMQSNDVNSVQDLLQRYLKRFEMAPEFTTEEIDHWLLHKEKLAEQVIWTYVVEEPETHKISDFISFYCLESSVIGNRKHDIIRAAYLYYYATEKAFAKDESGLKGRLNELMNDALILAKRYNFDVFNALTLLDNPLFLESQKFGPGDGQLHYYLYNYRTRTIAGGVDMKNNVDEKKRGGVGVVML